MSLALHDRTCARCPLAECDILDRRCLLKQAANSYSQVRKRAGPRAVPEPVREAASQWHVALKIEAAARHSETRP